jgi:Tfp pilus assembly protein PilO
MRPKQAFFGILGVLVLTLVGGGGIYYMADSYLNEKAGTISQLKAEQEIIELQIANANRAQQALDDLSGLDAVIDSVLPPQKIQSNLIGELVVFAERSGVDLDSISFAPTDTGVLDEESLSQTEPVPGVPGVNALPVNLNISGNYNNTLRFLQDIEDNQRKMQVETISLAPQEDTGQINSTLVINVYVSTR